MGNNIMRAEKLSGTNPNNHHNKIFNNGNKNYSLRDVIRKLRVTLSIVYVNFS